jgi:hypothetical protein
VLGRLDDGVQIEHLTSVGDTLLRPGAAAMTPEREPEPRHPDRGKSGAKPSEYPALVHVGGYSMGQHHRPGWPAGWLAGWLVNSSIKFKAIDRLD